MYHYTGLDEIEGIDLEKEEASNGLDVFNTDASDLEVNTVQTPCIVLYTVYRGPKEGRKKVIFLLARPLRP